MKQITQSTAYNLMVFLVDDTDHVTGKTGLTLTITASKDGAAFASITPTVTERVNGWYALALTTSHTDTLGDLALHITGTDADPLDLSVQIVADTSTALAAIAAAILDLPDEADIKAQVVAALAADTYAEPTGAPPATASLERKIGQLYKHLRNEVAQSGTHQTLMNDDGAPDVQAAVSDDGATFTRGEWEAVP